MPYLCPTCRASDLDVSVTMWARLIQDGDDFQTLDGECEDGSHEWTSTSLMRCRDCGYTGIADDFETSVRAQVAAILAGTEVLPMRMEVDDTTPF